MHVVVYWQASRCTQNPRTLHYNLEPLGRSASLCILGGEVIASPRTRDITYNEAAPANWTSEFGFWTCHVLQGLMSSLKVEGIEGSGFGELVSLDVVLVTRSCRSWQLFGGHVQA